MIESILLDNPAWAALNRTQRQFSIGTDHAKRYRRGILPFAACAGGSAGSLETLDSFTAAGESLYIMGDQLPLLPAAWKITLELPCAQLWLNKEVASLPVDLPGMSTVVRLGETDRREMYELVNQVQPGYYDIDTPLLGRYVGIRKDGKLVAMAGERMRLTGFSELSAICTLPGYTGKGYAQQLISALSHTHARSKERSFLHVAISNERAIRLYQHMGFEQRRTIIFRKLTRP
ncbi:MAG: GNAT family N-acetyltransferase [Chitinophagaceae bacterium]